MFQWITKKLIGSKNQRVVKRLWPTIQKINQLEVELQKLPDTALREKTLAWKAQLSEIVDYNELQAALDDLSKGRKHLELDVQDFEAKRSKYKGQLGTVKTNKEYTALLHEIDLRLEVAVCTIYPKLLGSVLSRLLLCLAR